jgi:hypothetical protein
LLYFLLSGKWIGVSAFRRCYFALLGRSETYPAGLVVRKHIQPAFTTLIERRQESRLLYRSSGLLGRIKPVVIFQINALNAY